MAHALLAPLHPDCCPHQVERALLDLCLDPSDSFLAAVAVDMGSSIAEGSVSSSVRLYEVGSSTRLCLFTRRQAGREARHLLQRKAFFMLPCLLKFNVVACVAASLPNSKL